jgi:hypothetical protein
MPLKPGNGQKVISENIRELAHHGSRSRSHEQIVAIALSNARKHPKASRGGIAGFATGGTSNTGPVTSNNDAALEVLALEGQGSGLDGLGVNPNENIITGLESGDPSPYEQQFQQMDPSFASLLNDPGSSAASTPSGPQGIPLAPSFQQFEQGITSVPSGTGLSIPTPTTTPTTSTSPATSSPVYTGGTVSGLPASEQAQLESIYNPSTPAPSFNPTASTPAKRGGIAGYAAGGAMPFSEEVPWWEKRMENSHPGTGFLNSPVGGRTDRLPVAVAADSYVMPADVVSGLGQGNSLAGARILNEALRTGPWGTDPRSMAAHSDIPRPPRAPSDNDKTGGATHHKPIMVAGGEVIVPPEAVKRLGKDDTKAGHKLLDQLVHRVREFTIKNLKTLPAPQK